MDEGAAQLWSLGDRAVAEVQGARELLSPAGLASGSPGEAVMLILHFTDMG